jgi:hypothetical protein
MQTNSPNKTVGPKRMLVKFEDESEGKTLAIKFGGKLEKADYCYFSSELERLIYTIKPIKVRARCRVFTASRACRFKDYFNL